MVGLHRNRRAATRSSTASTCSCSRYAPSRSTARRLAASNAPLPTITTLRWGCACCCLCLRNRCTWAPGRRGGGRWRAARAARCSARVLPLARTVCEGEAPGVARRKLSGRSFGPGLLAALRPRCPQQQRGSPLKQSGPQRGSPLKQSGSSVGPALPGAERMPVGGCGLARGCAWSVACAPDANARLLPPPPPPTWLLHHLLRLRRCAVGGPAACAPLCAPVPAAQMLLDDLPIWGYVGELETPGGGPAGSGADGGAGSLGGGAEAALAGSADNSTRYYLFTHLDFSLS